MITVMLTGKGYAEVAGRLRKCPQERDTDKFLEKCNETNPKPGYGSEPDEFVLQGRSRDGSECVGCERYMQKGKQSLHPEERVGRGESGG